MDGALDFGSFEALTFDCYGTLIDWESGILAAARVLLPDGVAPSDDALLERFASLESEAEAGDFRSYRSVLEAVATGFGRAFDFEVGPGAAETFAGSVALWPAFPDSTDALRALGTRYRLGIVSNVDDDLFAASAQRLAVRFSEVVTAQQVRSYKPRPGHFDVMRERLGLPEGKILHVAQSLYHDIGPASRLGYRCVWVNRRSGKAGGGATKASTARPDLEVPDLASLAELVERAG